MKLTPIQKFAQRVNIRGPDECWEWTGGKKGNGYGNFWVDEKDMLAHRWIFQQFHTAKLGRWDFVCHTCDNPPCVNPNHLFLGDNRINQLDSMLKHRHVQSEKTHCPQGHPYSGDNLYLHPSGYRLCRQCQRDRESKRSPRSRHGRRKASRR